MIEFHVAVLRSLDALLKASDIQLSNTARYLDIMDLANFRMVHMHKSSSRKRFGIKYATRMLRRARRTMPREPLIPKVSSHPSAAAGAVETPSCVHWGARIGTKFRRVVRISEQKPEHS